MHMHRCFLSGRVHVFLLVSSIGAGGAGSTAFADGTEMLGTPSISIASGTDVILAGVGLIDDQPGTIDIAIPAGATIEQVLVYWQGFADPAETPDDSILINGTPVVGTLIGGPTTFFPGAIATSFRADITDSGLVVPGNNTLTIAGLDFNGGSEADGNNGAGIVVIYDDGSGARFIELRDGSDTAFEGFAMPLDATVPQTFTFPSAADARSARLDLFAASVQGNRPSTIVVTIGGVVQVFYDRLDDSDGPEWDTQHLALTIPADVTSLTVQLVSEDEVDDDPDDTFDGEPASLVWVAAALEITPPAPPPSNPDVAIEKSPDVQTVPIGGDAVFTIVVTNTGDVDLENLRVTDADAPGCEHVIPFLAVGDSSDPFPCTVVGVTDRFVNRACVDADPVDGSGPVSDCDEAEVFVDPGIGCRFTGGGTIKLENEYTYGGQGGASTALPPQPKGEWTHHQKKGEAGSFLFHGGTSSASKGTKIIEITCSDPGFCDPARKAPAKQLDLRGVGEFQNIKSSDANLAGVVARKTLHYFEVHVEDLGEPGKSGKTQPDPALCPEDGNAGTVANCDCPDFYSIKIYANADPAVPGDVIYEEHAYDTGGNFQIHPPTGRDR